MDKIVWNKEFSVGVKELDDQHKELIKMINQLIDAKNTHVDSENISDILTEMTRYAAYHFKTEEAYMAKYDFPGYSQHKDQHSEFKKQTCNFCLDAMQHNENVPEEILLYLRTWLTDHILNTDMQFRSHFNKSGLE